ncbi:hypothetical protein NVIRENTERO_01227 [Sodalis praecaptivus]|nr:hypothetical protein NVIRENTERO_01227 [Sodalis praecaptivus]
MRRIKQEDNGRELKKALVRRLRRCYTGQRPVKIDLMGGHYRTKPVKGRKHCLCDDVIECYTGEIVSKKAPGCSGLSLLCGEIVGK